MALRGAARRCCRQRQTMAAPAMPKIARDAPTIDPDPV